MVDMLTRLHTARDHLRAWCPEAPGTALVLGSGYASLGGAVKNARRLDYREVPEFPPCTNPAHPGKLLVGDLFGHRVAVLQGRIHCYEGYRADEVVLPVRALALWGVKTFLVTNAAGAINPEFHTGEFMAITDTINLLGQNPLSGTNVDALGTRFPDMSAVFDRRLIRGAIDGASRSGIRLHEGVYAAMPGPSYETPAEIRMLRVLGADAVGMSTVPEVIALRHMSRHLFGLSCLTNLAAGLGHEQLSDVDIRHVLDRPEVQAGLNAVVAGVLDAAEVVNAA